MKNVCEREKEREEGERKRRDSVEKRSDGEPPLAAFDNEMDALGCVVAKRQHTTSHVV